MSADLERHTIIAELERLRAENARLMADHTDAVQAAARLEERLTAERDCDRKHNEILTANKSALMAYVERLRAALRNISILACEGSFLYSNCFERIEQEADKALATTPEAALSEVRAEAGRSRAVQELRSLAEKLRIAAAKNSEIGSPQRGSGFGLAAGHLSFRADEIAKEGR